MTTTRVEELRHALRLMDGYTPAARAANELLTEVDRLRAMLPPETPDPNSVEAVAGRLGVSPRTIRMFVAQGRFTLTPDGRVDPESLRAYLCGAP